MKLGVLDIGTNSIHILIAEVGRDQSFEILGRAKEMTRLGDGSLKSGFIARPKLERGLAVVKHFVQLARNRGVSKIHGVATAVIREASNGGEFVDRLQRETGLKIRTVTGEEEARLIYLAVRHFLDLSRKPSLIVDIGGGSAELIVGTGKELLFARSLKLGGARLKDLFITKFPVPKSDHARIHRHLRDALAPTLEELRKFTIERVIGTSGSLINLGSIVSARRDDRPFTNPQGFCITKEELEEVHRDLARADERDLESMQGIDPKRKDILLPPACLLLETLETLGLGTITLCDKGIREGILLDYIAKNARKLALEDEIPNVRQRSVLQLANRCEFEESHGKQTARLALALYDQLPLPGDLHPAARELLEYGALVHDIGYHVSFAGHHKHAWYLIQNTDLYGFSPEEIEIIAGIARYHRKRAPKSKDALLRAMPPRQRRTIALLAAITRVADALDRSHFGVVEALRVSARPKTLTIRVSAKGDPAMEIWTARQKTRLLEKLLGKSIHIEGLKRAAPGSTTRARKGNRNKTGRKSRGA